MNLKNIIGVVAPWLATAATGPLGGMAVTAIADAFGLTDKTTESIQAALSGATPEQMLALKNADREFGLKMQELGFKNLESLEKLVVEDRKNAREREVQVKDSTNKILAYTVVSAFIMVVGATLLGYAKVESVLAGTLVGYLSAKCEQVLSYYFGSSSGSAKKTDLLARAEAIK